MDTYRRAVTFGYSAGVCPRIMPKVPIRTHEVHAHETLWAHVWSHCGCIGGSHLWASIGHLVAPHVWVLVPIQALYLRYSQCTHAIPSSLPTVAATMCQYTYGRMAYFLKVCISFLKEIPIFLQKSAIFLEKSAKKGNFSWFFPIFLNFS